MGAYFCASHDRRRIHFDNNLSMAWEFAEAMSVRGDAH